MLFRPPFQLPRITQTLSFHHFLASGTHNLIQENRHNECLNYTGSSRSQFESRETPIPEYKRLRRRKRGASRVRVSAHSGCKVGCRPKPAVAPVWLSILNG